MALQGPAQQRRWGAGVLGAGIPGADGVIGGDENVSIRKEESVAHKA